MSTELSKKALLVRLKAQSWGGSLFDQEVTEAVARDAGADERNAGRYIKQLLAKDALVGIGRPISRARTEHYRMTVPWEDGAYRLLPTAMYDEYVRVLDDCDDTLTREKRKLIREYRSHVDEARVRLGRMFREKDYPDEAWIESHVRMEYTIRPVPDVEHFVADLADGEASRLRDDMKRQIESQIQAGVNALYHRMFAAVSACAERLELNEDGSPKIFRDSIIENIKQLAAVMPRMNVTDNPTLAKLGEELGEALDGVYADNLRERSARFDPVRHQSVKEVTAKARDRMAGYFGVLQNGEGE